MIDNYILTFPDIKDENKKELQLFFQKKEVTDKKSENGTIQSTTETKTSTTFKKVNMTLYSVKVEKEMYKPGCITAEVLLMQEKSTNVAEADISTIVTSMLNKTVNVDCAANEGAAEKSIAVGYRVVNIQPRRKMYYASLQTVLTLTLYSPDKYLDMMKYSKCYTAKRLGQEVIGGLLTELASGTNKIQITLDYTHQQNMWSKEYGVEGIHPYLVQYNETPYHFLVRSANRCGEFLFYEDGKLWLGLDTSQSDAMAQTLTEKDHPLNNNVLNTIFTPEETGGKVSKAGVRIIEAGDISDVVYNEYQEMDQYGTQSSDYTVEAKTAPKHIDSGAKVQTYEGPSEEYLNGYEDKKEEKYTATWVKKWPSNIYSILQADDPVDMVFKAGTIETSNAFLWGIAKTPTEKQYKEDYVDYYKDNNERHDSEKVYQFCLAEKYSASLTRQLYQMCRERSEVAQKRTVFVKLRAGAGIIVKLGDFVNIFGREYVVTKVHSERKLSDDVLNTGSVATPVEMSEAKIQQMINRTLAKHNEVVDNWFEAVPALAVLYKIEQPKDDKNSTDGKDKKKTEIKYFKTCYAPTLLADNQKRTAAPQRAYVNSTDDPLSLGRIRILYPWQSNSKKDDEKDPNILNSSPFIRVAQPFATGTGGIRFTPQVGDEVMIGYEFDDIERPFMIGAVASQDTNGAKVSGNGDIICSPNGHKIQFTNPKNPYGFVTSFSPVFGTLQKWGLVKPMDWAKYTDSKGLAGGIQLTDQFGIYNLELSSDKRKISIQSQLGTIQMDAFTGITINCPNGDIALKGKNITIEAGDKLSIASGKNIDKQKIFYNKEARKPIWTGLGTAVGNFALESLGLEDFIKANVIDLKTTRALMDAIFKPINGTMSIKSGRFMQLEAGSGRTELPNFYKENTTMHNLYDYQANNLWMRYLLKLGPWYDERVNCLNFIATTGPTNIENALKAAIPAGNTIEINNATKTQDEYLADMKRLYDGVTKNTQAEIDDHLATTVNTKLSTVKTKAAGEGAVAVQLSANVVSAIKAPIKALLDSKLSLFTMGNTLETFMGNGEDDHTRGYKATVIKAFENSKTFTVKDAAGVNIAADAAQKKRKFFYDIIKKLVKDGKLKYYQRKSYNKILKVSAVKKDESVCADAKLWGKFVGTVGPIRNKTIDTLWGEYSGWRDFITALPSTMNLWEPSVKGGAILIADSNTQNHTVTFYMGDANANIMGPAAATDPVNLKAVSDGGTSAARKYLGNIK